jgi:hypothetical protein
VTAPDVELETKLCRLDFFAATAFFLAVRDFPRTLPSLHPTSIAAWRLARRSDIDSPEKTALDHR